MNVASRINAVAIPGSVLVSEIIHNQLENQPSVTVAEVGTVRLRNVRHPMRLFAVSGGRLVIPSGEEVAKRAAGVVPSLPMTPGARPTPSIVVLPFVNMSGDLQDEYFCDGLAEDLIHALSKIEGLKVVARTSAFSFKGRGADVREIGEKLGVGSVMAVT